MARRKSRSFRLPSEWPWAAAGIVLGAAWFAWNLSLAPVLKGRVCCDSTDYIKVARHLDSWSKLADYNALLPEGTPVHRAVGYPAFLAAHLHLVEGLGLQNAVDPVNVALVTGLLLYFAACVFLFASVRGAGIRIHPVALTALLAHPGLTSHAALPLTDTFSTSLLMLGAASLPRAGSPCKDWRWAGAAGLFIGWAALARPSLRPLSILLISGWAAWSAWASSKNPLTKLAPFAAIAGFAFMMAPQYLACSRHFGKFCFQDEAYVTWSTAGTARVGLLSGRGYAVLGSHLNKDGQVFLEDS